MIALITDATVTLSPFFTNYNGPLFQVDGITTPARQHYSLHDALSEYSSAADGGVQENSR